MATAQPRPDTTLFLRRKFAAPPEKVFRAFTEPEALKRWWMPNEGFSVPAAEIDLRVGGSYRVAMKNPKGEVFYLSGTYREIRPPERLVYTWRWEATEMDIGETLVTVDFRGEGGSTELQVTHELFPDALQRDRHGTGWSGCLDHLPTALR
ncbi:MAG: SRPBCC family protein [Candidatus Binatia bacterium]